MPRAQKRKRKIQSSESVKSVFFYGVPNKEKAELLRQIQKDFTDLVNHYIGIIDGRDELILPVLDNDIKGSALGAFEKTVRVKGVNSAFSQNAFYCAASHLSNRLNDIRLEMMRTAAEDEEPLLYTRSKVLFSMMLQHKDKAEMIAVLRDIASATKKNASFYAECADFLLQRGPADFLWDSRYFHDCFTMTSAGYSVPVVRRELVPLDSRLMTVEQSKTVCTDFVLCVSQPYRKNQRIEVPLYTSKHSVQRMKQYKCAGTVSFTVLDNGTIRVQRAVTRKNDFEDITRYSGVDTGMNDCFHTSEGKAIGTMNDVIEFYKNKVEPSFAGLSDMRNKKRKILHYVRRHKNLPSDVRRSLIEKADMLEHKIRETGTPYRKKRHYRQMLEHEIKQTVESYISGIDKSTMTVIELLDLKEFNKSRALNGKMSVFARGRLHQKLMESLTWRGYQYTEVFPEYTSQVCPRCCHLDKNSREGKRFVCTCCGYRDDADHVGALNILERITNPELKSLCEKYQYQAKARGQALIQYYRNRHNDLYPTEETCEVIELRGPEELPGRTAA